MRLFFDIVITVAIFQTALAYAATFNDRLGDTGRRWAEACIKAPFIDLALGLFTWIPWFVLGLACGWRGVIGSIIGQVIGLYIWIIGHEYVCREAAAGPRIVKVLNRVVGRWQNHLALWVTAVAFPGFLFIRLMEVALWPALVAPVLFDELVEQAVVATARAIAPTAMEELEIIARSTPECVPRERGTSNARTREP